MLLDPNPLPTDEEMYDLLQGTQQNPISFTIQARRLNPQLVDYRVTDTSNGGRVATCFAFENALMVAVAMNHCEQVFIGIALASISEKFHG